MNHTAFMVKKQPWIKNIGNIEAINPLGSRDKVYMTGIETVDDDFCLLVQGNYSTMDRMVWIPEQTLLLEVGDIKVYAHPNGAIYTKFFMESFSKVKPDMLDAEKISEEGFTGMIVMPDGSVVSVSANHKVSNEKLQALIKSMTVIEGD